MKRTLAVVAAAAACLVWAAPSLAANPVVVGQAPSGGTPDIAVDPVGRAHIVWNDTTLPAPDVVKYCQLPRGGSACGNAETFTSSPNGIFGRPHVFSYPTTNVSVFYQRCCGPNEGTRDVYSANSGIDFSGELNIGNGPGFTADEAVYSPATFSYSLLSEVITGGARVQNGDISLPLASTSALLGSVSSNEGAIALQANSRPVVVYQLQTSPWTFVWRKFNDVAPVNEASINNSANWTPEAPIDNQRVTTASGPALAGGPNGVFLFWQKRSPDEGFVSKFTGSGWTAPVKISDNRAFNDLDLYQDAGGRLHAVWNAYNDGALRYRWSDDGVNWSPVVDIARGESYHQVRVSAAVDHRGFAIWNRGGPDVVAVPLEALPPLPPSGSGSGSGSGTDFIPPAVGDFSMGSGSLLPGQGTGFRFNSSEAGLATLTLRRRVPGLRVRRGGRSVCVPRTRRLVRRIRRSSVSPRAFRQAMRRRRCPARRTIGRITQAVAPGQNTIVFTGRVAGRRLRPGRYFAELQIRDAAGNVSRTETLQFRVRRPRRRP